MRGYKAHTVRDQVRFLSDAKRIQVPAFEVVNRLQGFTPGEQLVGTAVALKAMCESAGISLEDVMTVAGNLLAEVNRNPYQAHMQAVRDYAAGELARGECATQGITPEKLMEELGYTSTKVITYG